jgi:hypothetical protein
VVVLDPPIKLPEDTPVQVEVEPATEQPPVNADEAPTWFEVFKDVIGQAEGLPD